MINALYTLKKEYFHKKIYIWNINRDSLGLFMRIMFSGIDVQGFVVNEDEYLGQVYLNFPIVSLSQVKKIADSIIFITENVSQKTVNMLHGIKIMYWAEASGINVNLRNSKIIIYGMGGGAKSLCKVLEKEGIEEELYCVTESNGITQHSGKKVIEAVDLGNYTDYSVIISVTKHQHRGGCLEALAHFPGKVYLDLDYLIQVIIGGVGNALQSLDYASKMKKNVYLYSPKNHMSEFLRLFLERCGIKINGYVNDVGDEKQDIKNIYELVSNGIEDKFILLNEEFSDRIISARKAIECAGFSLEKTSYTSFQWHTCATKKFLDEMNTCWDPLVGGSICYSNGKPGWAMYGSEEKDKIRILILGNSTSSEDFYIQNWISKLYNKLQQNKLESVIYNGAHSANDIVDEILRFLRDGNVLQPQIVISMSGVNNLYYKECENQFNSERMIGRGMAFIREGKYCCGVKSTESLYHFWYRNEQILKMLVEFYGAQFYCFLQPMNMTMEHMTLHEKSIFEQERRIEGALEFRKLSNDNEGYVNLMRLFEHQEDMYIDLCHYTDKANAIIADKVYETIMPALQAIIS